MSYEHQLLTLSEAAKLTGKSRTTLWRAVNSGKLSAEKGENDQWVVHLSELERVYHRVNVAQQLQNELEKQSEQENGASELLVATSVERVKVEMLQQEKERLLSELHELREELREERKENRTERDKLLDLVETAQKQLTHERGRFDDELKKARIRMKAFAQSQKQQNGANSNKILKDGHSKHKPSLDNSNHGLFKWLFGR